MRVEWLQKHPTPAARGGDFHWYPGAVDAGLRAEIAAGAAGALTIWVAPERVVVARRFAAVAPADDRPYHGLAVVVADGPLAAVPVPAPSPWPGELPPPAPLRGELSAALVAAAWHGGTAPAVDVDGVPARLAALDPWLPAAARAARRRIVLDDVAIPPPPPAAAWLARALALGGAARERALATWTALQSLPSSLDDTFAAVAELAAAFASAAALRDHLARAGVHVPRRLHADASAADQWSLVLHGFGRGLVAASARDALAAILARRVLADHLAVEHAPRSWRRTLRCELLLPSAAAADLEHATLPLLPPEAHDA